WRNLNKYPELLKPFKNNIFSGVMCSGHMFLENVQAILTDLEDAADKGSGECEILFHPGSVLEQKDIDQITCRDDLEFLTSDNRRKEAHALKSLVVFNR
ncbi:MAG: hypothetical protein K6A23_14125, partial [Butyrivibrio sp.]|nr:hypothetical protein [Butyrivibrio sp.]